MTTAFWIVHLVVGVAQQAPFTGQIIKANSINGWILGLLLKFDAEFIKGFFCSWDILILMLHAATSAKVWEVCDMDRRNLARL